MLHALSASVLALTLQLGPGAPASPPPARTSTDAGPPTVDSSRLEEARTLVPLPLLYGKFRPEVGAFVEYDVTAKEGRARVRAAVVGRTERKDGPMFQIEFEYLDVKPRSLVVLCQLSCSTITTFGRVTESMKSTTSKCFCVMQPVLLLYLNQSFNCVRR